MPKLIILGSSNAVADENHENTHMAVVGRDQFILIDCPGSPIARLRKAGLDFNQLSDLILTHFHPDHVSGVPLLLMDLWLLGRQEPLNIYGLDYTLGRVEKNLELYNWTRWPDFFPVKFTRLPEKEMAIILENEEFRVFASPVHHLIPTIGLRIEFPQSKKALAYSCDTQPCEQVIDLARGAEVLLHETAGPAKGHSGPLEAGRVAQQAGAKKLLLIHYPTGDFDSPSLVSAAAQTFNGPVDLAQDFMEIQF
jgi:ribonuclease Z